MDPTSRTGEPRKSRVFLIDDHPLVREGLVNLINSQRDLAVCGEAEDSAGAMTGIAKTRPDVALVDISLKNESGLELVKNLESQFPLVALITRLARWSTRLRHEAREHKKRFGIYSPSAGGRRLYQ